MPYIYTNPYKSSYQAAIQEIEQLKVQRENINRRIAQLEQSLPSLQSLANEDAFAPTASLPELCAQILQALPKIGLTANDVMQALANRGVNLSGYSNPLALLHTTLTRLCRPGCGFNKGKSPDGQPIYFFDPDTMSAIYRSGMRGDVFVGGAAVRRPTPTLDTTKKR